MKNPNETIKPGVAHLLIGTALVAVSLNEETD